MRGRHNDTPGTGGNEISGSVVGSNVQMNSGNASGGMSMIAGGSPNDALAQALAGLRELQSALEVHSGEEAEQARAAASVIESALAEPTPDRALVRKAHTKLQEIALYLGGIAAAVNSVGAALLLLGLR